MPSTLKIGTAESKPGTIQYGRWHAFSHPTGLDEFLPVVIAQGLEDGPCLWLTAGIHGDEHSGPLLLHHLLHESLIAELKGTLVVIPVLNPPGMRVQTREPYHLKQDPNRIWPSGKPEKKPDPEEAPPSTLEQAFERLFDHIQGSADFLIDFHNTWIHSFPFSFRDRVLYRSDINPEANKQEAEGLAEQLDQALKAFGHTIINEFSPDKYIDLDLHRSTSGAALLLARIPAFTVELGSFLMPDMEIVDSAIAGTRNFMRWAGMLESPPEELPGVQVFDLGYPVRRSSALRAEQPGLATPLVKSGDLVKAGDPLVDLRDIWGRSLQIVTSPQDALVLSPAIGIPVQPGQTLVYLGVKDTDELVGAYPADYFDAK
jgi:predicted deacylase